MLPCCGAGNCTIFRTVIGLGTLRFLRYVLKSSAPRGGRALSAQLLQAFGEL